MFLENLPEPHPRHTDAPSGTGCERGSRTEEQRGGHLDSLGSSSVQSPLPSLRIFLVEEKETAHPSSGGLEQVEIFDKLL